jgi:hypothetical protein
VLEKTPWSQANALPSANPVIPRLKDAAGTPQAMVLSFIVPSHSALPQHGHQQMITALVDLNKACVVITKIRRDV